MFLETKAQELERLPRRRSVTQSGRQPQASSQLHFMKGLWASMPLEWKPDLKGSRACQLGTVQTSVDNQQPPLYSALSQVLLHTKKVSLFPDCCPVRSTGCFTACWALGKADGSLEHHLNPCRMEGTGPTTYFLSGKDQNP